MLEFGKYNANPKGKKTGDCVVRALSVAMNKDYEVVMRDLFELGLKKGFTFNDQRTYEAYLLEHGWIKVPQPRKKDKSWYRISDLDQFVSNWQTTIVTTTGHVAAKVGNVIVDTFDCRQKFIGNYFINSNESPINILGNVQVNFAPTQSRRIL